MMGITPAALIFKGIYWRTPPYCLFPTTRFAYCTGILRVPCTNMIEAAITTSKKTISTRNMIKPPPASVTREANSLIIAPGRREIIPTK